METLKTQEGKKIEAIPSYSDLSENFKNCKLIHIQILKVVYKENRPLVFSEINKRLKILGSERTLREKIYDLEAWKLIEAIHSRILIITPIIGKEKEIVFLISSFYNKMGDTY